MDLYLITNFLYEYQPIRFNSYHIKSKTDSGPRPCPRAYHNMQMLG
jgi:hypothetical protein